MTATVLYGPWAGTRQAGQPPAAGYLAERERLGIPSHAETLLRGCRGCGARESGPCHVPFTAITRGPHEARTA